MEINKTFLDQLRQQKINKNVFEINQSDDEIDECNFEISNHNQNAQQAKDITRSDSPTFEDFEPKKSKDSALEVSKEPIAISAKSQIVLEIKPYSDEIDLSSLINHIFDSVKFAGLVWKKETKILPIAFGLKKLQVACVIEDDKVCIDDIVDKIMELEEVTVDIMSFFKI
ncbi:hypothetical protein ABPG74_000460 [Tetrahymena malaccensis]